MPIVRLPRFTPSWRCGVPTDPCRWRKVVTVAGGVAIEAQYTAAEYALMLALCPQVPLVVAMRALELVERYQERRGASVRGGGI